MLQTLAVKTANVWSKRRHAGFHLFIYIFFSSQFFFNLLSIHKKTYKYTQKMSQIVAIILDVNGDYESAADGTVKVMSIGNACCV